VRSSPKLRARIGLEQPTQKGVDERDHDSHDDTESDGFGSGQAGPDPERGGRNISQPDAGDEESRKQRVRDADVREQRHR